MRTQVVDLQTVGLYLMREGLFAVQSPLLAEEDDLSHNSKILLL